MPCKLLIATNNKGKANEYRQLLAGIEFDLVVPSEVGIGLEVEETGATMEENALLKATTYARESGLLTLADDSGLEVDALDGEPGVKSARYAGPHASDADRVNYLLSKLEKVPWEKRTARFRCVIAVSTAAGQTALCDGECQGIIAFEPRGGRGFGYDPIFYLPEFGRTMAEVPDAEKNNISHRGRAARKVPGLLSEPPFPCTAGY